MCKYGILLCLCSCVTLFAPGVLWSAPGAASASSPGYLELLAAPEKVGLELPDKGVLPEIGNYFDPASEGWGLDIQRLGNAYFAVWFTYNPDGSPTWYIIVGTPTASDKGLSVTGNIESFKWDAGGDPGEQATASVVGTMTIAWSDATHADVSWTLDGEAGAASVEHIRFALPPTPANMTGHYFDPLRPGWGFTLLTQGAVTVMTMYWYKDGQPVWAQGVQTRPGFGGHFLDMLYFNGPGLCPSCLDKDGAKGLPTTEVVANLYLAWGLDDPPLARTGETVFSPEDGLLGPEPFGDIQLPATARAVTSAAGDNFDPEYEEFIAAIQGATREKGPLCLPFLYDLGIFKGEQDGTMVPAYFQLEPVDGYFPMFEDAGCTQPFELANFEIGKSELSGFDGDRHEPSKLMLAWTGEEGAVYKWWAWYPNKDKGLLFGRDEGYQGGLSFQGTDQEALFDMRWNGVRRFIQTYSGEEIFFSHAFVTVPESLELIEQDPGVDLFTRFTYLHTSEPAALLITHVQPFAQIVNIGDPAHVKVSVTSSGPAVSGVKVLDNRGSAPCTPRDGTTVDASRDYDWDCTVTPLPGSAPVNGTLNASGVGATGGSANYTLNPTQLTVANSGVPLCINPGGAVNFNIKVTHNNIISPVSSVNVSVSGAGGACDTTLVNVPSGGSSFGCSYNPGSLPARDTATATSTAAKTGNKTHFVRQCPGVPPDYCSDPEHNALLAPGVVSSTMPLSNAQLDWWNNSGWFNTPSSTEHVTFPSSTILALPFQPPGPGTGGGDNINNGRLSFSAPGVGVRVSISDCPGDFSDERPFQNHPQYGNDTALGFADPTPDPGDHPCVVAGATLANLKWAMNPASAIDDTACVMLVPGATYYLNIGFITPDGGGGWLGNCAGNCTVDIAQSQQ